MIQMLLSVPGINKEAKCCKGVTPLKLGISRGNSVFVSILANTRGVSLYFEDRSMDRGGMRAILMEARRRRERRINLQERANEERMEREMSGRKRKSEGHHHQGYATGLSNLWVEMKSLKRKQAQDVAKARRISKQAEADVVEEGRQVIKQIEEEYEELLKQRKIKIAEITQQQKENQNRQASENQEALENLSKEHKAQEVQMITSMLKEADEERWLVHEDPEEKGASLPPPPDCPICFSAMIPPIRIFQCTAGHLVCSECRPKIQVISASKKNKVTSLAASLV